MPTFPEATGYPCNLQTWLTVQLTHLYDLCCCCLFSCFFHSLNLKCSLERGGWGFRLVFEANWHFSCCLVLEKSEQQLQLLLASYSRSNLEETNLCCKIGWTLLALHLLLDVTILYPIFLLSCKSITWLKDNIPIQIYWSRIWTITLLVSLAAKFSYSKQYV